MSNNKIEKLLNKGIKIKIPDKLEKRNIDMIEKISQKKSLNIYKNKLPFLIKPVYAAPIVALFIIVPVIIFILATVFNKTSDINYRDINDEKMNSIILENQIKNLKESNKIDEVKNVRLKKQDKNIIINWENPVNNNFIDVVIERFTNRENVIIYKGNSDTYIDLYSNKNGVYYLIKVINKDNEISKGIKVNLK